MDELVTAQYVRCRHCPEILIMSADARPLDMLSKSQSVRSPAGAARANWRQTYPVVVEVGKSRARRLLEPLTTTGAMDLRNGLRRPRRNRKHWKSNDALFSLLATFGASQSLNQPSRNHSTLTMDEKNMANNSTVKIPDNLYQRGGTWYIRYSANGRKIRKSLKTTSLREAKRLRNQVLAKRSVAIQFGLEEPEPVKQVTFAEIEERWIQARDASSSIRPTTFRVTKARSRTWIVPFFGHMLMSEIDLEIIESFISYIRHTKSAHTGKVLSQDSVSHVFKTLGNIYRQAIRRGWYTGSNPIDRVERKPRPGPGRDVTLTEDEARRLLDELGGELYYKVALALSTGLRWGELHGLEWTGDLELEAAIPTLAVRRSYSGPPKNEASKARVPLSDSAASLLQQWRQVQGKDCRWVFPTTHGQLRCAPPTSNSKRIHKAAARAGIQKNVTPHVFRHTFGTWLYERTGDPKLVQRLLRHASFHTSMRYVHDRRNLGEVVNRMPKLAQSR